MKDGSDTQYTYFLKLCKSCNKQIKNATSIVHFWLKSLFQVAETKNRNHFFHAIFSIFIYAFMQLDSSILSNVYSQKYKSFHQLAK